MKNQTKIYYALFFIVGILLAGLLAAAWYFSSLVLFPGVSCDPNHFIKCGPPSDWGLDFENIQLNTSDGLNLPGWYIPAPDSEKSIILVHGHGGTINEGMRYASALHNAGYNLLAFNLRRNLGNLNEGEAGPYFFSMGCHEKKDVIAAVDYLISKNKRMRIGVFGFSMGAVSSIFAMAEDERIEAGIFNSPFANFSDQLAEVAKKKYGLPRYPLIPLVVWFTSLRTNCDLFTTSAQNIVANISPRPIFIFHCQADDYIDVSHAQRIFEAAKQPKSIWIAPCNKHVWVWNQCRAEVEDKILHFFNQSLQPTQSPTDKNNMDKK